VKGYDPRIEGDSHGYCKECFKEAMGQVDRLIADKEEQEKDNDSKK
jgi:hypothetical protein